MNGRRIRVLVVDDSAVARKVISDALASDPEINVVGGASDPFFAREKILLLKPDVITLDIEMPRMDGLTFLKLLMRHRPMPVVVMSSLTADGSEKALEALQCGAVEVLGKASHDGRELVQKVKAAAVARVARPAAVEHAGVSVPRAQTPWNARTVLLFGASTGGTEALKVALMGMPQDSPPICVAQHIPAHFSGAFANRLNSLCEIEVREAKNGDELEPGLALIAPGGKHLLARWIGSRYVASLGDGPAVHHQKPAVDVLFDSVVKAGGGRHAVAALLTGMGKDGAAGLSSLRGAGAGTIAQSENTCVVFGMPREAIALGAAQEVLDLEAIAPAMMRMARRANGAAVESGELLRA